MECTLDELEEMSRRNCVGQYLGQYFLPTTYEIFKNIKKLSYKEMLDDEIREQLNCAQVNNLNKYIYTVRV